MLLTLSSSSLERRGCQGNNDEDGRKNLTGTFVCGEMACEKGKGGGETRSSMQTVDSEQSSTAALQRSSAMMRNRYPINIRSLLPTPFVKRGRWSLRIFLGCPSAAAALLLLLLLLCPLLLSFFLLLCNPSLYSIVCSCR
jgi:hypothetical protein